MEHRLPPHQQCLNIVRQFISAMLKLQLILLISLTLVLGTISFNQSHQNDSIKDNSTKTENYKPGDCFEFKKGIKGFGVIFLEEKVYPDGRQFNLFPVKLDTTKTGLDKFKFGKVYFTGFPDFTKSSGRTEGFMVYHFLSQKDVTTINSFFNHVGSVQIKDEYLNTTGGTVASSLDEFRTQLNLWDRMFGDNGRLVTVTEILQ